MRHVKFNYELLSDEHEREGKLWYLVHWSITFVVNGSVCHNYENDKEALITKAWVQRNHPDLLKFYKETKDQNIQQAKDTDIVHKFIWPPCWLPETDITKTNQRAFMFSLARKITYEHIDGINDSDDDDNES